jgi:uncharacterized phage-associated protein
MNDTVWKSVSETPNLSNLPAFSAPNEWFSQTFSEVSRKTQLPTQTLPEVLHLATFVLQQQGTMTTMKLHKLLYYCQAWSLVWEGEPLFAEPLEAWAFGPVVRDLYELHAGRYEIDVAFLQAGRGRPEVLNESQRDTVTAVLHYYGSKPSSWLSDLIRSERPWQEARRGLPERERGHHEISLASLAEYYEGVYHEGQEVEA